MPFVENSRPSTLIFEDDGLIPNKLLPFVIYRGALSYDDADPEKGRRRPARRYGWGQDIWRDGIYDFTHYHATAHEVLGVARGHARVRFGGEAGEALEVDAGDVAILPAGTGHQCLRATTNFSVVGAYPLSARMQAARPTLSNHCRALNTTAEVKLPQSDPVMGIDGPLLKLWKR